MLLLLHKPYKAVGTFRASPWYDQSCYISEDITLKADKTVWGSPSLVPPSIGQNYDLCQCTKLKINLLYYYHNKLICIFSLSSQDELGCGTTCGIYEMTCANGNCITTALDGSAEQRCDTFNDCGDYSDEFLCDDMINLTPDTCTFTY